jgi:hypothetical protein
MYNRRERVVEIRVASAISRATNRFPPPRHSVVKLGEEQDVFVFQVVVILKRVDDAFEDVSPLDVPREHSDALRTPAERAV